MRGETGERGPLDAAALFDIKDHLLHSRDRGARESFAVKVYIEPRVRGVCDANRPRILPGAAKKELTEAVRHPRISRRGMQEKRAGSVSKKAAELSCDAARSKHCAMNVRCHDKDRLRLSGTNQSLRYNKRVQQSETRASDVHRAARFSREKLRMKLRCQRRIAAVRLAGAKNPVEFLRSATGSVNSFLCCPRGKGQLIFAIRNVRQRFNSRSRAQFSRGHPERAVHLFRSHCARAEF